MPVACIDQGSAALCVTRPQALIVDDCRFIAERMARVLEARGFDCVVAANGYAGMELLRERNFAMIVIEINTPMVDGFTLLRYVRRTPDHMRTPVLMLSGEDSVIDHDRAIALGANGYMPKPLQLRPLTTMLDSLI